jgi:hypothetical protein
MGRAAYCSLKGDPALHVKQETNMITRKSIFALAALATVAAAALSPSTASAWGFHGGGFHGGWNHGGWNHWGWRGGWRTYGFYRPYRPYYGFYRPWWPPAPVGYGPAPVVGNDGPPPPVNVGGPDCGCNQPPAPPPGPPRFQPWRGTGS